MPVVRLGVNLRQVALAPVKFKCPANKTYMKSSTGHLWKLGETESEVGTYVGVYNQDEETIDFYVEGADKPETPVW